MRKLKYSVKFVSEQHHKRAWKSIASWGYPLKQEEFKALMMVEVGNNAAWYWFEFWSGRIAFVHIAADPAHRGRWCTRHVIESVRWAAEFVGLRRVYGVFVNYPKMDEYMERSGWKKDNIGWYSDGYKREEFTK